MAKIDLTSGAKLFRGIVSANESERSMEGCHNPVKVICFWLRYSKDGTGPYALWHAQSQSGRGSMEIIDRERWLC